MPEPFNYSLGEVPDPTQALVSGLKLGAGIQDMQAKQAAQQAALAQQRQQQEVIGNLIRNPNASGTDYANAVLMVPGMKDQLKQAWETKNAAQVQAEVSDLSQYSAAIQNGKPELAIKMMREKADLLDERNGAKTKESQILRTRADIAEKDPNFANFMIKSVLAGHPEGQKTIDSLAKIQKEPSELKEGVAKAEKAAVDAKFAEKEKIADLEKAAADFGLTKANTNKAIAETKKLGIEASKAILELQAIKEGKVPPKDSFEFEEKLRKEYQGRTKSFDDAVTQFDVIKASAADKSGAGDIALVTAFNKMLDPGSVVRETEFANSRDTAGLLTKLQNAAQKVSQGSFLDPKQRADFVRLAGEYYKAAEKTTQSHKNVISTAAKNYKLNEDNIFGTAKRGTEVPSSEVTVGGKTYARPANFTDEQWNAYKKSQGAQ